MYTKRRFSIFILLICLVFILQGCGTDKTMASQSSNISDSSSRAASIASSAPASSAPASSAASKASAANTQLIDADTYSLEIPSSWTKMKVSGVDMFLPQGADITKGSSNVNIVINAVSGTALSLANYKASLPAQLEKQIKSAMPSAANFQYSDGKAGGRDVFIASFDATATAKQTQYYPINSQYVVVLTVTDIGDGDKIGLKDISKHMLDTLVLK